MRELLTAYPVVVIDEPYPHFALDIHAALFRAPRADADLRAIIEDLSYLAAALKLFGHDERIAAASLQKHKLLLAFARYRPFRFFDKRNGIFAVALEIEISHRLHFYRLPDYLMANVAHARAGDDAHLRSSSLDGESAVDRGDVIGARKRSRSVRIDDARAHLANDLHGFILRLNALDDAVAAHAIDLADSGRGRVDDAFRRELTFADVFRIFDGHFVFPYPNCHNYLRLKCQYILLRQSADYE